MLFASPFSPPWSGLLLSPRPAPLLPVMCPGDPPPPRPPARRLVAAASCAARTISASRPAATAGAVVETTRVPGAVERPAAETTRALPGPAAGPVPAFRDPGAAEETRAPAGQGPALRHRAAAVAPAPALRAEAGAAGPVPELRAAAGAVEGRPTTVAPAPPTRTVGAARTSASRSASATTAERTAAAVNRAPAEPAARRSGTALET